MVEWTRFEGGSRPDVRAHDFNAQEPSPALQRNISCTHPGTCYVLVMRAVVLLGRLAAAFTSARLVSRRNLAQHPD